jgi:hypothetical protein
LPPPARKIAALRKIKSGGNPWQMLGRQRRRTQILRHLRKILKKRAGGSSAHAGIMYSFDDPGAVFKDAGDKKEFREVIR